MLAAKRELLKITEKWMF